MDKHDWMISVLDDLEDYAKENGLFSLSDELSKLNYVARTEVALSQSKIKKTLRGGEQRDHLV